MFLFTHVDFSYIKKKNPDSNSLSESHILSMSLSVAKVRKLFKSHYKIIHFALYKSYKISKNNIKRCYSIIYSNCFLNLSRRR